MFPKISGKFKDKQKRECLYIGNFKSGDYLVIKFMRPEQTKKHTKKAIIKYVSKYVLKNKTNDDLELRAVKSFLKMRPFTTSRNLFPRTIMRKVKNEKREPLYKKYSIFQLTKMKQSGELQINIIHHKETINYNHVTYAEHKGIPLIIEEIDKFQHKISKVMKIEVSVKGEIYTWEANRYYISSETMCYEDYNREFVSGVGDCDDT